jgi:thioredoxin reductase (NADPH)
LKETELAIIGGGPAGLTAAVYGCRAGLRTLLIEKAITGGQMRLTSEIENWPGLLSVEGADLSDKMREQAEHFGTRFQTEEVLGLNLRGEIKLIKTSGELIAARAIVVASGTRHRNLDCPGAAEFVGRGVSFCAICDAAFMRNETVAVVGGGNSALEEALYLTRFAKKVYLIHRRDELRADKAVADKARASKKIEFRLSSLVEKVDGTDIVEKITLRNLKNQEATELEVAGLFLFVGTLPNSEFLPEEIKKANGGWILTSPSLETSVPGVFAAGDVRETDLRQVITAAADGARAAMSAYRFLEQSAKR